MDADNPVVKLCAQGMEHEGRGDYQQASRAFKEAWNLSTSPLERCIAAHYVARHQTSFAEALAWNERSLEHADEAEDPEIRRFYPSLFLNLGKSYEDLGNKEEAKRFYEKASNLLDSLQLDKYGDLVRDAVARALIRVS